MTPYRKIYNRISKDLYRKNINKSGKVARLLIEDFITNKEKHLTRMDWMDAETIKKILDAEWISESSGGRFVPGRRFLKILNNEVMEENLKNQTKIIRIPKISILNLAEFAIYLVLLLITAQAFNEVVKQFFETTILGGFQNIAGYFLILAIDTTIYISFRTFWKTKHTKKDFTLVGIAIFGIFLTTTVSFMYSDTIEKKSTTIINNEPNPILISEQEILDNFIKRELVHKKYYHQMVYRDDWEKCLKDDTGCKLRGHKMDVAVDAKKAWGAAAEKVDYQRNVIAKLKSKPTNKHKIIFEQKSNTHRKVFVMLLWILFILVGWLDFHLKKEKLES